MVREATENAVKQIEKEKQDKIRNRYDRRLRNTEMLLRNYNNFKEHADKAIYEDIEKEDVKEDMDYDKDIDNLFINSIRYSSFVSSSNKYLSTSIPT